MRAPADVLRIGAILLLLSVGVGGQNGRPTVDQVPIAGAVSTDLRTLLLQGDDEPVRAIVRGEVGAVQTAAARDGLHVVKLLDGFVVLEARPSALQVLQGVPGIDAISLDVLVAPTMTVSDRTMAADQARAASPGLFDLSATPSVSGRGIGVAVVDSGIASHAALTGKVVAAVNFATGETNANDEFGHGTHIAGIIAGVAPAYTATTLFKNGVAPGAHLINVRVLGGKGVGYTSDVIAGIQWVIANRARYAIRVLNLSLGHPIVEPCATDPLCLTAESAATAGLVVVASAGNSGKDASGRTVMGSISTPGNAPSVITVGALNTWNTISRDDDTVTTYSSRGPTRFDMGMKPDVVAPGNKIVSLEAPGSYLAGTYPTQRVAGKGTNAYFVMSGTSMAAGMVSGGAALLLESAPTMTARHVKVSLQLTASPMRNQGITAAGTGSVNLLAARKLGSTTLSLLNVLPSTTIGGRLVRSSGLTYVSPGAKLDQAIGAAGLRVFGLVDVQRGLTVGLTNRLSTTTPAQIIWGGQGSGGQQIIWGDQVFLGGQQIIWGDQILDPSGQQIIWGDHILSPGSQQIIWGDQIFNPSGQQIIWGDQVYNPSGEQIIWGDHDTSGGYQIIWGDSTPPEGGW